MFTNFIIELNILNQQQTSSIVLVVVANVDCTQKLKIQRIVFMQFCFDMSSNSFSSA